MTSQNVIRVLAVDDHPLLRAGIAAAVNAQPGMSVVAEASSGEEAVELFRTHKPDITLMDLRLPKMSGTDAIAAIRKDHPRARFIVLTTFGGDVQALRAFKAGASGYLLKSMMRTELTDTVRLVHSGCRRIPPEIAAIMAEHAAEEALTGREVDVLRSVAEGNSNKLIASDLFVSEHTVKGHIRNILSKLGASDRTHAVIIGLKRGILDL
jgi:DNA-binding NarL/FixJ family response regulator